MRVPNRSGTVVPSPQGNTGRGPAEFPGARDAAEPHALGGIDLPLHRAGLVAIVCALVVGCGTHKDALTTAPQTATVDASADASIDVSELGGTANTPRVQPTSTLGGPLGGLDAGLLARFNAGRQQFVEEDSIEQGLGPVFNEAACATCHDMPVGGTNGRAETRFGRVVNGRFDPLAEKGGSLLQDHAIGTVGAGVGAFTFVPETVPPEANVRATRITRRCSGWDSWTPSPTRRSSSSRSSRRSAHRRPAAWRTSSPRSAPARRVSAGSAGSARCRRCTSSPATPT